MRPEEFASNITCINERIARLETLVSGSSVGQQCQASQDERYIPPVATESDRSVNGDLEASFTSTLTWRLDEVYTVAVGQESLRHYGRKSMLILFSTTRQEGTDFYLHVEGVTNSLPGRRYRIFQGQAQVFASGEGGLGPYVLRDGGVRKIYIQNGQSGTVTVAIYV